MSINRAEEVYMRLLKERSGQQRMMMGFSMFETAKALVKAGILSRNPDISETDLKVEIFKRFYSGDFDAAIMEKIINKLQAAGSAK